MIVTGHSPQAWMRRGDWGQQRCAVRCFSMTRLSSQLKPSASVVVTASSAVYEGAAATAPYAATKGPLVAAARCWARAFAPRGIRVNTLVPGPIDTGFSGFLPDETRRDLDETLMAAVPLHRVGTADEAAAVALFPLSGMRPS